MFGGGQSEKLPSNQLEMFDDDAPGKTQACAEKTTEAQAVKKARKSQPRWPLYPENLPVVEEILDPEAVKANPLHYRQIGQEVSEQLDYEPGRFFLREQIRRTWVKRNAPDTIPVTAPLPPILFERGLQALGLLAYIVIGKYADHLKPTAQATRQPCITCCRARLVKSPILDRLLVVFDHMLRSGTYKPKTITGTAIAYALRQREGLQVYVDQGPVEIDNSLVENAIRPADIGRKN